MDTHRGGEGIGISKIPNIEKLIFKWRPSIARKPGAEEGRGLGETS